MTYCTCHANVKRCFHSRVVVTVGLENNDDSVCRGGNQNIPPPDVLRLDGEDIAQQPGILKAQRTVYEHVAAVLKLCCLAYVSPRVHHFTIHDRQHGGKIQAFLYDIDEGHCCATGTDSTKYVRPVS